MNKDSSDSERSGYDGKKFPFKPGLPSASDHASLKNALLFFIWSGKFRPMPNEQEHYFVLQLKAGQTSLGDLRWQRIRYGYGVVLFAKRSSHKNPSFAGAKISEQHCFLEDPVENLEETHSQARL